MARTRKSQKKAKTSRRPSKTTKKKTTKATAKAKPKKTATKRASRSSSERRREHRAKTGAWKVKVDCRDVDVFVSSKIMNISKGGILLKTRKPPPKDTPLDIEFYLPAGQEPVHATGSVVWISPAASRGNALMPVGVGIHFDNIDRKDLKKIEAYIEEASKNENF